MLTHRTGLHLYSQPWQTIVYEAGDRVVLNSIALEFAIAELYRDMDN